MLLVTTSENEMNRFCSMHGRYKSEGKSQFGRPGCRLGGSVRTKHKGSGVKLCANSPDYLTLNVTMIIK